MFCHRGRSPPPRCNSVGAQVKGGRPGRHRVRVPAFCKPRYPTGRNAAITVSGTGANTPPACGRKRGMPKGSGQTNLFMRFLNGRFRRAQTSARFFQTQELTCNRRGFFHRPSTRPRQRPGAIWPTKPPETKKPSEVTLQGLRSGPVTKTRSLRKFEQFPHQFHNKNGNNV